MRKSCLLVALLLTTPVLAKTISTPRTEIPISVGSENASFPKLIPTGDGYIVTWNKSRTNYYILTAKIDLNGHLLWKTTPFAENNAQNTGDYSILGDNQNGVFIAQLRYFDLPDTYFQLRIQRISAAGEQQWGEDGKSILGRTYSIPTIVPDGNGGIFVAWLDEWDIPGEYDEKHWIAVQKFNSVGDAMWFSRFKVSIPFVYGLLKNPILAADGHGGVILGYTHVPSSHGEEAIPMAQRIDADGTLKWGTDQLGIQLGEKGAWNLPNNERKFTVLRNVNDTVFFSWIGKTAEGKKLTFVQKIDDMETGHLAWGNNGVPISSGQEEANEQAMVSDENNGAWVFWREDGIYAYHLPSSGIFTPSTPITIAEDPYQQGDLAAASDHEGGAIVTWRKWELTPPSSMNHYIQRIDSGGTLKWADGIQITNGMKPGLIQTPAPVAASGGKDKMLVVWTQYDDPSNEYDQDLFGQLLDYDGNDVSPSVLSVGDKPSRPEKSALLQNYPNPFNPSTTVRYTLAAPSPVMLKVYDSLGRKVATLVNGETQQAGAYEVKFNTGGLNLPSGVYFYKLQTKDGMQTGKMLLQK